MTMYRSLRRRQVLLGAALVIVSLGAISIYSSRSTAQPIRPAPDTQTTSTELPSPSAGDSWSVDRMRKARPAPMPTG